MNTRQITDAASSSGLTLHTRDQRLTHGGGYNRSGGRRVKQVLLGGGSTLLILTVLMTLGMNILPAATQTVAEDTTSSTATGAASIAISSITDASGTAIEQSQTPTISVPLAAKENQIITGQQKVTVATNSVGGYRLEIANGDSANNNSQISPAGTAASVTTDLTSAKSTKSKLAMTTNTSGATLGTDNTWGVATSTDGKTTGASANFVKLPYSFGSDATDAAGNPIRVNQTTSDQMTDYNHTITFAARVDNPVGVAAGSYVGKVVYTAAANLPPEPTFTSVSPDSYRIASTLNTTKDYQMTIEGSELSSAYGVYLVAEDKDAADQSTIQDSDKLACDVTSTTATSVICTIPTTKTDGGGTKAYDDIDAGISGKKYHIYVQTQAASQPYQVATTQNGKSTPSEFSYYKVREVAGTAQHRTPSETDKTQFGAVDGTDNLIVTLDPHMIPIKYAGASYKSDTTAQGATETAKWSVVTNSELAADSNSWFNYDNTFNGDGKISGKTAKWANAITVKANKLDKYLKCEEDSSSSSDCTNIPEDDVLGYWVYIPRYAYRVRRYQASDKFVSERNFDIHFETASAPKSIPAASCNPSPTEATAKDVWGTDSKTDTDQSATKVVMPYYEDSCTGKEGKTAIVTDYHGTQQENGEYTDTSWATHPAFTFGNKELNGFWMAKYEITGSKDNNTGTKEGPTIKPNEYSQNYQYIGSYMAQARSMGVADPNNTGDFNGYYKNMKKDSHSLSLYSGMLATNKQWGAAVYLSASQYGAGLNNVYNNSAMNWYTTDDSGKNTVAVNGNGSTMAICYYIKDDGSEGTTTCLKSDGSFKEIDTTGNSHKGDENYIIRIHMGATTGCGPDAKGASGTNNSASTVAYDGSGNGIMDDRRRTSSNKCAAGTRWSYQGDLGVLASTTNNVYGIYDMAGGTWDYVAANLTNRTGKTASTAFRTQSGYTFMGGVISSEISPPYVDLFSGDDGAGNTTNTHSYDLDTEWTKNNGLAPIDTTWAEVQGKDLNSSSYVTRTNWTVRASSRTVEETTKDESGQDVVTKRQVGNYYSYRYNNDYCTWSDCGGGALYETKNCQSVNAWNSSWGSGSSIFPYAQGSWLIRGGRVGDTSGAGVFATSDGDGGAYFNRSARVSAAVY